jgi:hypothetical protein
MSEAMRVLAAAAAASAALVAMACGSTAALPSAPTQVSRYPSLLGAVTPWRENRSSLVLSYPDSPGYIYYNCDAQMYVSTQTDGTFTGGFTLQGVDPRSDRACTTSGAAFTAQMTPDGTVTSLHLNRALFVGGCTPMGDATVRGSVTSTTIRFEITDRARCPEDPGPDAHGPEREFDRTLTVSVLRLQ